MQLDIIIKSGIDTETGKVAAQITVLGFESDEQALSYANALAIDIASKNAPKADAKEYAL